MSVCLRFLAPGLLVFLSLLGAMADAAPPSATYLTPAGGQRGTTVTVTVGGTFDTWPVLVWSSQAGVTAEAAKGKGKLTVTIAPNAEPGVAWLRLHDKQGASAPRPFVVGTLPETEEKEPNDAVEKAQTVDVASVVVNGVLAKPGDVDCYAVKLRKDQTLSASLLANETLASPMDAVLQILDGRGFVLEQNHDIHGLDPQVRFTASAEGTYVVRLFTFPAKPDSSIRHAGAETYIYRLTLATAGTIDHAWPLAVPRATPGEVELVGPGIAEAANRLPVPAKDDVAQIWRPDLAGLARVRLEPHPCFRSDEMKDQAPPFSVSGRLDSPAAVSSLPFRGTKGKPLVLQVEAASLGSLLTPTLRVRDTDGKQLAQVEAAKIGQEAELAFTPPADGLYRLEVSDAYRGGGARYWFLARATPPAPDFSLSCTLDRLDVAPGKPADLTVTVTRRGGFKGEIELVAENLPAGVKATTTRPAKPDGKTLVMRFTAEKAGASGPVHIVGKSAGVDPRPVVLNLPDLGSVPIDLWLTAK